MTVLLYIVFCISCFALIGIILLQEGKGGGLGDAFGGMGGETFGHRAGPINKITAGIAAVMILSLVLLHTQKSKPAGLFVEKSPAGTSSTEGVPPGNVPVAPNAPK